MIEDKFADHKPDLSMYLNKGQGKAAWEIIDEQRKTTRAKDKESYDARRRFQARTAFAWSVCVFELKFERKSNPFGPAASTAAGTTSAASRVQMVRYVVETFLRQHREFVFSVFITRDEARLMRWDRCGCVMTEAFNYLEHPEHLLNFIYALAHGSRAFQGYDTSFSVLEDPHQHELDELFEVKSDPERYGLNSYESGFLGEMMEKRNLYPLYRVSVMRLSQSVYRSNLADAVRRSPQSSNAIRYEGRRQRSDSHRWKACSTELLAYRERYKGLLRLRSWRTSTRVPEAHLEAGLPAVYPGTRDLPCVGIGQSSVRPKSPCRWRHLPRSTSRERPKGESTAS